LPASGISDNEHRSGSLERLDQISLLKSSPASIEALNGNYEPVQRKGCPPNSREHWRGQGSEFRTR